jgi:hypothetical protein
MTPDHSLNVTRIPCVRGQARETFGQIENIRRGRFAGGLALILTLALTGCTGNSRRDLEGIPNKEPEKAEMYANIDGYPNVVRLCIDHVAFATTTRDSSPAAIFRVPEWDVSFCGATVVPK